MKIINGLEKINFGNGEFYAITCGEIGCGRKMGFIPICKSLSEKIEKKIEWYIKDRIESSYQWSLSLIKKEASEDMEHRIKLLKQKYNKDYEIKGMETELMQGILKEKEILDVLKNVKIITTKRGGMLLVENDKQDDLFLYSTHFWGGYRGSVRTNIEKINDIEIIKTGVLADGLAGNMANADQYIISFKKEIEIEIETNNDRYGKEDYVLVVNNNGEKKYTLEEYTALKDIKEN